MIRVLIDFPWIRAFWIPLLPPAPHLLDFSLLGAHDVLCELLYLWDLALSGGYLGHVYGRLVMRDHGVDKAPVGVPAVLHDHLFGHSTRAHAHRPVAHLAVAARVVTLLITPCAPAGS